MRISFKKTTVLGDKLKILYPYGSFETVYWATGATTSLEEKAE